MSLDVPAPVQAFVIPWPRDLYGRHESPGFITPAIVGLQGHPGVALVEFHARVLADVIRSVRGLGVELKDQHRSVTVFPQSDGSLLLALQASTWDNEDAEKFRLVIQPQEQAIVAASLT